MTQLTPQELQIAMILARGKNDEGGRHQTLLSSQDDRLHLRKAYRKPRYPIARCAEGALAVEKGGEGFLLGLETFEFGFLSFCGERRDPYSV
jgi:hypothetical protein